jgi:hypothetical protein
MWGTFHILHHNIMLLGLPMIILVSGAINLCGSSLLLSFLSHNLLLHHLIPCTFFLGAGLCNSGEDGPEVCMTRCRGRKFGQSLPLFECAVDWVSKRYITCLLHMLLSSIPLPRLPIQYFPFISFLPPPFSASTSSRLPNQITASGSLSCFVSPHRAKYKYAAQSPEKCISMN